MFHLYALAVLSLAFANTSYAAHGAGNGGKGVYCPQTDGTRKLLLLDYDRAQNEWGMPIVPAQGSDEIEKALDLASRLDRLDPDRANRFKTEIRAFMSHAEFLSNREFKITLDSDEIHYCKGGQPVQIVVQGRGEFAWENHKRYLIDASHYEEMDLDQRAGLIFHEVVLRESLFLGRPSADWAMRFNAQVSSGRLFGMSKLQYDAVLVEAGLRMETASLYSDIKNQVISSNPTLRFDRRTVLEFERRCRKSIPFVDYIGMELGPLGFTNVYAYDGSHVLFSCKKGKLPFYDRLTEEDFVEVSYAPSWRREGDRLKHSGSIWGLKVVRMK